MATIIQNLACFEIRINTKSKRVYMDEDILQGKEIEQIFFYAGNEDRNLITPFAPPYSDVEEYISSVGNIDQLGIFANLFEPDGAHFCKNLFVENNLIDSEYIYYENQIKHYIELNINRILDTQKSYLSTFITGTDSVFDFKVLMYVLYKTRPVTLRNNIITGSYTVDVPLISDKIIEDIKLSNVVDFALRKYPVKKIIAHKPYPYNLTPAFLYLKAKNSLVENMPIDLISFNGTKEYYFDNLLIDFEQSYFKKRGSSSDDPQKLTFIY